MSLGLNDLWRKVFRSSTKSVSLVLYDLCKSKVCDSHMAILVNKQVLWFQVSVSYVH